MQTFLDISALRATLKADRATNKRIGFVPTMGNLHEGHLDLVRQARQQCDIVVASIFVNPTQFGAGEDFDQYPRTLLQDEQMLATVQCDYLFAPAIVQMYSKMPPLTTVQVSAITAQLCGLSRPGHFEGVATVVCKLLNIVQPDILYLGQKDYQQLQVVKQMVADLSMSIQVEGVATRRAPDGLALSSRNQYLTERERAIAPCLYQTLQWLAEQYRSQGKPDIPLLEELAQHKLLQAGFAPEYVRILPVDINQDSKHLPHIILAAARLGKTRLIDNLFIE